MKLTEITLKKIEITSYMHDLFPHLKFTKDYTIDAEGKINTYTDVTFPFLIDPAKTISALPVQFGEIDGFFDLDDCGLTTFKGCPRRVGGYFSCRHNPISSLEFAPQEIVGGFYAGACNFTSLVGVNKRIKHIGNLFEFDASKIMEGGIGLILIEGLREIDHSTGRTLNSRMPEPFKIIAKYLGKPNQIYECQAELIENGFEEFAKL